MSREDFVAVASRLFSIFLLMLIVQGIAGAIEMISDDGGMDNITALLIFHIVLMTLVSAFLWFFPMTVAKNLLPNVREPKLESTIGFSGALSVGFILIGIWFLGHAVVEFFTWLVMFVISKQINDTSLIWTDDQIPRLASAAAKMVVALWLIVGNEAIKRLIFKSRRLD